MKKILTLIFSLLLAASAAHSQVANQFITISSDGKFLVNALTNEPVFVTGDAPQTLIVQVSNADVQTYFADRVSRGFNVLWVYPVDKTDQTNAPQNYYGNVPFDGADFTNEDAAYWEHVDYVVQQAQAYGITLIMDPGFVGLTSTAGYLNSYLNSSDAVVNAYGQWIGNRYKGYPNIIWSVGGDADPTISGLYEKLSQLATGIQTADPNHLMTFEGAVATGCDAGNCTFPSSGGYSSLDVWGPPTPSWLNLNWVYSPNRETGPTAVQTECASNYARSPWLPPLQGEDWYELEAHGSYAALTALQMREQDYWEVLSGCYLGRIQGNNAIWTMGGPGDTSGQTWQSQLGSAGSLGQEYLGKLMNSREHWQMVPDANHTVLTAGYGSGTTLSVASRTSDGQTIIAYIPNGNATTITVAMGQITSASSTVQGWWYNPSTGGTTNLGTFPNSGTQTFAAPDGNDWVLVLDDAGASLPAPGTSTPAAP